MKKKTGVIIGIIALLVVAFLVLKPMIAKNADTDTNKSATTSENVSSSELKVPLDGQTLKTKIEDKEDFTLYVYSKTCSACKTFEPTLTSVLEKSALPISSIDVTAITHEEAAEIFGEDLQYTPTIFTYRDGVIVSSLVGAVDAEEVTAYFAENPPRV